MWHDIEMHSVSAEYIKADKSLIRDHSSKLTEENSINNIIQ